MPHLDLDGLQRGDDEARVGLAAGPLRFADHISAISNDLANATFRPGWLRSVGPGWTNWALESFMDEAAHHLTVDPAVFRLKLLTGAGRNAGAAPSAVGGSARRAGVVRAAAARAGWGRVLPADSGLGIATSFGQERDMPPGSPASPAFTSTVPSGR